MTNNSARRQAARRLQAQLDIPYMRALRIVDADNAARVRRREGGEPDPAALLASATCRLVTATVNDWLLERLTTVAVEDAGLPCPFPWLSEGEIEAAGALALAAVANDETADSTSRVLVARHEVFLMVSGWVNDVSVAMARRRDHDLLVLEEHVDGNEVLIGPLQANGAFRVELLPDERRARVLGVALSWSRSRE